MKKTLLTLCGVACLLSASGQTLTDGLKVHLRFHTNTNDTSGNGNHGTLVGDGTTLGWACLFDGSGDYVTIPSTDLFNAEYSFSLWFKTTDAQPTNTKMVLFGVGGADCNQSLTLTNDFSGSSGISMEGNYHADSTYKANSPAMPALHYWSHVVGIKTADSLFLYVDGNLAQGIATPSQTPCYSGADPRGVVGASVGLNQFFAGSIGDVRIYNRPLSRNEVFDIFSMNMTSYQAPHKVAHNLFPNPVSGREFTLQTEAVVNEVRLFDFTGKEIAVSYDAQNGTIKLNAPAAPGTYFLSAESDQGFIHEKITVQ